MPAGGLISGGLGVLMGVGQAIWGNSQKKKYQRQIDELNKNRPQYQINQEEYDIQNLAESKANQGMGAGARTALQNNTDRTLSTAANTALMGGADANTIGNIVDKSQNGNNQNAIYNDQVRLQNLSNLQNVWARQSANRDKQWQINSEQPWKDKMTGLNDQLKGANNMFMSGLSQAGSGLTSIAGGLFGGGGGGSSNRGGGGGQQSDAGQMPQQSYGGGGNAAYGGSNLGAGGYTAPQMVSPQYPTNDQATLLNNNQQNPWG